MEVIGWMVFMELEKNGNAGKLILGNAPMGEVWALLNPMRWTTGPSDLKGIKICLASITQSSTKFHEKYRVTCRTQR